MTLATLEFRRNLDPPGGEGGFQGLAQGLVCRPKAGRIQIIGDFRRPQAGAATVVLWDLRCAVVRTRLRSSDPGSNPGTLPLPGGGSNFRPTPGQTLAIFQGLPAFDRQTPDNLNAPACGLR